MLACSCEKWVLLYHFVFKFLSFGWVNSLVTKVFAEKVWRLEFGSSELTKTPKGNGSLPIILISEDSSGFDWETLPLELGERIIKDDSWRLPQVSTHDIHIDLHTKNEIKKTNTVFAVCLTLYTIKGKSAFQKAMVRTMVMSLHIKGKYSMKDFPAPILSKKVYETLDHDI